MPESILSQIVDPHELKTNSEKANRMKRAEKDFAFFCEYYLSNYFFSDFAPYQKIIIDIINQNKMTNKHIRNLQPFMLNQYWKGLHTADAIKAFINVEPRGHGKTTRMGFGFALWSLLFKKARFVVLIGASTEASHANIDSIREEIESNERIIDDFGHLQGDKSWSSKYAILSNDTAIIGLGAGSSVRGKKYKQYRPDLVIVDDLLKDEEANSKAVRNKRYEWFLRSIVPLGKNMKIVMNNTILHNDDIVSRLLARIQNGDLKNWVALRFSAIIPTNGSIEKGKVLWDYWSREELLEKKHEVGSRAFYIEYQNEPVSPDEAKFNPDWFKPMPSSIDLKDCHIYIACDPATGAHDKSAIVVGAKSKDSKRYCLESWGKTCSVNELVTRLIDIVAKYNPHRVGIESVAFQEMLKDIILQVAHERGVKVPLVKLMPRGRKKHMRIDKTSPYIENGTWTFNKDACASLIDELVMYPKGEFDDEGDAFAYLDEMMDGAGKGKPQAWIFGKQRKSIMALQGYR